MTDTIAVLENGQPIRFGFDDLIKYHGYGYPGGVAHAFKVMQRAFPLLAEGERPERNELQLKTLFTGPGARDAFEVVTRMVTTGRFTVEPHVGTGDLIADWMAKYDFTWRYRGKGVRITIRPGHVREEFIRLAAQPERNAAEEARLDLLKTEMADRLMATPPEAVYDAEFLDARGAG
jgi:hypothetical protein